jgi:hypothetical protein
MDRDGCQSRNAFGNRRPFCFAGVVARQVREAMRAFCRGIDHGILLLAACCLLRVLLIAPNMNSLNAKSTCATLEPLDVRAGSGAAR